MRVKRGEISEYIHKYLVTHRFRELEPNKQDYKRVLKDIHTETVKKTIHCKITITPPPINPDLLLQSIQIQTLPAPSLWTHPIEASNFLGLVEDEEPDPGKSYNYNNNNNNPQVTVE